jgi:hypothetical protein
MQATRDDYAWMALARGGHPYPRPRPQALIQTREQRVPQRADADAAAEVLREADAGHSGAAERIAVDARIDGLTRQELEALVTLFHVEI